MVFKVKNNFKFKSLLTNKVPNIKIKNYKYNYFGNSGSELLAKLIDNLNSFNKRKLNVYIPGYFCGQSLKYLRLINVNIKFYKLSNDLMPDYEYLELLTYQNKIDILILVHYFGKIRGQEKAINFSKRNNITLIEDCAHIKNPILFNSWVGDFLIFSPHKHFDIPQIGILFSKTKLDIIIKKHTNKYFWFLKKLLKRFI